MCRLVNPKLYRSNMTWHNAASPTIRHDLVKCWLFFCWFYNLCDYDGIENVFIFIID